MHTRSIAVSCYTANIVLNKAMILHIGGRYLQLFCLLPIMPDLFIILISACSYSLIRDIGAMISNKVAYNICV